MSEALTQNNENTALILLNYQTDYMVGGVMAVPQSLQTIPNINRIKKEYPIVVFCNYNHPQNHFSFKRCGGSTPDNCTNGDIHFSITISEHTDCLVHMETRTKYKSSSAFWDCRDSKKETTLLKLLEGNGIKELHFGGLDGNNIFYTVLDAFKKRFECVLISDLYMDVNDEVRNKTINKLKMLGVDVISTTHHTQDPNKDHICENNLHNIESI